MKNDYNPKFRTLEDLFGGEAEEVLELPVEEIDEFPEHPFKVVDDEEMKVLTESISRIGITTPLLVRKHGDRYELISGHRRKFAALSLGMEKVPALVKSLNLNFLNN